MRTTMKYLKSLLVAMLLMSTVAIYASSNTSGNATVTNKIESYLNSINYEHANDEATVFSNLILKENEDLITVDFMVTEDDEIVVLSKDFEEEYYRVELYNSNYTTQYSLPVAFVNPE